MNKKEEKVFPVFTYGIYAITLFSACLILLQSSSFAVTSLPAGLSGFAEFFPGPAWKIASLYAHHLPERAENYRSFFSILVLGNSFVFLVTFAICLYKTPKEKFNLFRKPEKFGVRNYALMYSLILFSVYVLFFSKYIDYNLDFMLVPYNINYSNIGYVLDILCISMIYFGFSIILYGLNKIWHIRNSIRVTGGNDD